MVITEIVDGTLKPQKINAFLGINILKNLLGQRGWEWGEDGKLLLLPCIKQSICVIYQIMFLDLAYRAWKYHWLLERQQVDLRKIKKRRQVK